MRPVLSIHSREYHLSHPEADAPSRQKLVDFIAQAGGEGRIRGRPLKDEAGNRIGVELYVSKGRGSLLGRAWNFERTRQRRQLAAIGLDLAFKRAGLHSSNLARFKSLSRGNFDHDIRGRDLALQFKNVGLLEERQIRVDESAALLGEGGFGKVRRGTCGAGADARKVAIKQVCVDQEVVGTQTLDELVREAEIHRQVAAAGHALGFEGLVVKSNREALYVMEPGLGNVRATLEKIDEAQGVTISPDEAARLRRFIARGMIEAIAGMHAAGFTHFDMKPENFLLARQDGELVVKACDFGTAGGLVRPLHGAPDSYDFAAPELLQFNQRKREQLSQCDTQRKELNEAIDRDLARLRDGELSDAEWQDLKATYRQRQDDLGQLRKTIAGSTEDFGPAADVWSLGGSLWRLFAPVHELPFGEVIDHRDDQAQDILQFADSGQPLLEQRAAKGVPTPQDWLARALIGQAMAASPGDRMTAAELLTYFDEMEPSAKEPGEAAAMAELLGEIGL